ncbi:hypothetical protein ACTVH1_17115 [Gluconobacter cerinus]
MKHRRLSSGLGLLEILLALFIGGLIAAGVLLLHGDSNDTKLCNEQKEEMLDIVAAARFALNSQPDTSKLNTYTLGKSGLLPRKYSKSYGSGADTSQANWNGLVNAFGGPLYVFGVKYNGIAYVQIWVYNISKRQCISMVTQDYRGLSTSQSINFLHDSQGAAYTLADAELYCKDNNTNYLGYNFFM